MIKGKVRRNYTLEEILETSSEYDIFRRYIGHDFDWGVPFESPFRRDNNPSFTVTNGGNFIYFRDWADDGVQGNIVEFLKRIFPGKNYGDILSQVAEDMGTGYLAHIHRKRSEPKKKEHSVIQVVKREFDTADLEYWKGYYQTKRDLEGSDIYAVKSYRVNGKIVPLPVTELCYGYLFQGEKDDYFWKIYRPFAKEKKDKWRYSGPNDYIYGLKDIRGIGKTLITKSLKDWLVMKKIIERVACTQSEAKECFNKSNLLYIESIVEKPGDLFINFDSDEPGVKASKNVCDSFGFSHINVPKTYTPVKDFADLAKVHGLKTVEMNLKLKNII